LEIGSCFRPRKAWIKILLFVLPRIAGWQAPATTPSHWLRWGSWKLFVWVVLKPLSSWASPPE
jgi:hypothetical protein